LAAARWNHETQQKFIDKLITENRELKEVADNLRDGMDNLRAENAKLTEMLKSLAK
jgi:predicted nuclease with TOPRIM domain